MRFLETMLVSALALVVPAAAAHELPAVGTACTCAEARKADGWCALDQVGYIAGLRIPSQLLYEALDPHGHPVNLSTFTCPECRTAIDKSGFCERDSIGFVRGQAYFSRLTYEIARAERVDPARIDCPACRKNSESLGWCERCKIGMLGNVSIRDRAAFEQAARSLRMVQDASEVAQRCERCAVALVTSSECPLCRIEYRDGKRVVPVR